MSSSSTAGSEAQSATWGGFLKNMASFSGDLSSLTAPPFILSATSLTEYSAYWVSHPTLLTDLTTEKDAEKRAVLVLKWFLSTLKQQYSSRNEKLGSEKKPLNPFLGEIFLGEWKSSDSAQNFSLVSEQVSHHPPVTAYDIQNTDKSVQLTGYNGQKASMTKTLTITVKQIGHATLKLPAQNESYIITLPELHIEGLMSGSPFVELGKSSYIISDSGYTSRIDYTGRGWISGKKNSFTASLYKSDDVKKVLYNADGQWTGTFSIKDASKNVIESWDPKASPATPLTVKPVEEQDAHESRKAWQKVAEAIGKGDMDTVHKEKSIIENRQRDLRKKEKEDGREWTRQYFKRSSEDKTFTELAGKLGEKLETEKTDGVWVWKE